MEVQSRGIAVSSLPLSLPKKSGHDASSDTTPTRGGRVSFPHAPETETREVVDVLGRREALIMGACFGTLLPLKVESIQQSLLAGRVPGLSTPDESGVRTYRRPDAKSGGHGVGWSPIIPYSFKIPLDWEEVPVSIADLGGTEIDLRFLSKEEGSLSVVVAPVLRFSSDEALAENVSIEKIGPPDKVIYAFGPEIVGDNVEGKVKDMEIMEHDGRMYYVYELDTPHAWIAATAAGNRLYLMTVSGNDSNLAVVVLLYYDLIIVCYKDYWRL